MARRRTRALAIARAMANAAPNAVRLTKLAINRSFDAMGLRDALASALELDIFIEASGGTERAEFDRIRREQGLKAALAWRDGRSGRQPIRKGPGDLPPSPFVTSDALLTRCYPRFGLYGARSAEFRMPSWSASPFAQRPRSRYQRLSRSTHRGST